jgi:tRNA 2-thiouridine synthesizing protein C
MLMLVRHSPYGSSLAKSSLDVALATAAFEQAVDVLFMGDGVLQLLPDQNSTTIGKKNVGRQLASLPLYDINFVYVDAGAAARYNVDLSALALDARPLNALELHQLMVGYDHLLGF